MKELFAIKHITSQGYLQLEPEAGNYIVDFEDNITTFGTKSFAEWTISDGIYVEAHADEGESEELDSKEFVIVKLTITKETEV